MKRTFIVFLVLFSQKSYSSNIKPYAIAFVHLYRGVTYFGHISFEIVRNGEVSYYSYPSMNRQRKDEFYYGSDITKVPLYLTQEQYSRFIDWYENSFFSRFLEQDLFTYMGHYHIIRLSCVHFVEYSLRAMGFDFHRQRSLGPPTPLGLFQRVVSHSKKFRKSWNHKGYYSLDHIYMNYVIKPKLTEKECENRWTSYYMIKSLGVAALPNFQEKYLFVKSQ